MNRHSSHTNDTTRSNETRSGDNRVSDALKYLDEVALDRGEEILEMITDKYKNLHKRLVEIEQNVSDVAGAITEKVQEFGSNTVNQVKSTAKKIDSSVQDRPWTYIGGFALGGLILGLFLGMKGSNK